jgi:lipooligosaccharide transport system permease protein
MRAGLAVSPLYVWAVTRRHGLVWRKLIWSSLVTNVANPLLFLFAFGFGLGRFIETADGTPYLAFVVPGMIAYSAMFAASFETTIGAYTRYSLQRSWDAVLATPVTLKELLLGEVVWAALKGMISAASVLVVGILWGGVPEIGNALLSMVIVFLAALGFASQGLLATAYAKGYDFFSYFFTFWVTPMFVFSGVFFDLASFPTPIEWIAWALPMTHLLAVVRPLSTGAALDPALAALHIGYTIALAALVFALAYRRIRKRMFD